MIELCYALYDKHGHYAKFVGTSIKSMLDYTKSSVRIHIIHDNTLTEQNRQRLEQVCRERADISFYNAERLVLSQMQELSKHLYDIWVDYYSPAILYRFILWEVLPSEVEKVIYLDADLLFRADVAELWQEPLGENGFAAVVDSLIAENPQGHDLYGETFVNSNYFNAGVFIMSRQHAYAHTDFLQKVMEFFTGHFQASFPDQDALNYLFAQARRLPIKWNRLVGYERKYQRPMGEGIYHFSGEAFNMTQIDEFLQAWWNTFCQTPWCDGDTIRRMGTIVSQIYERKIVDLQQGMVAVSGKKRVAVCEPVYIEQAEKLLQLKAGEEIIPCPDIIHNLPDFTKARQQLGDDYVFIFFADKFNPLRKELQTAGWQSTDYFDGRLLLRPAEGGYRLDEHSMVLEL